MKILNIILLSITFLMIPIGMLFGLSLATSVLSWCGIYSVILFCERERVYNRPIYLLQFYKIEIVCLFWIFLSCIWSIDISHSLLYAVKLFILFLFYIYFVHHERYVSISYLGDIILYAFLAALLLFYIEYFFNGIITQFIRNLLNTKKNFELYDLDRGCAMLSFVSWLLIAANLRKKQYITAFVIYLITAVTLGISHSLASFVGLMLGGIVFILYRFLSSILHYGVVCFMFCIAVICLMIFYKFYTISFLNYFSGDLPFSTVHRLFIWEYVAEESITHWLCGHGHAVSKIFASNVDKVTYYNNMPMHLMPLHPHSAVLQIFFELGIVGIICYMIFCCKVIFYISSYNLRNNKDISIISCMYGLFTNHFIISIISYSTWQTWWVCLTIWVICIARLLISH